jgi:hypothetical protein
VKYRTTATAVFKLMTPAQRAAVLEYAYHRWESDAQTDALDDLPAEIDRDGLSEAMGLTGREWNGAR